MQAKVKPLEVVDRSNKHEPKINNLNENAQLYSPSFNHELFCERKRAITPSHQFPTIYQLQQTPRYEQKLGEEADGGILRYNMFAFMPPKMQRIIEAFGGLAAHHVVEGKDSAAQGSRQLLAESGIDINDADNRIFLHAGPGSIFKGTEHRTKHTDEYSQWVYSRLLPYEGSRADLIAELTWIKHDLYECKHPLQASNQVYHKNIRSNNRG